MDSNRREAQVAGILLISGMVAGMLSIAPAIDAPDFLIKASANANQVLYGALFQFIMTITYAGFAITLYPVLRKHNEHLALGFLSFRIIAAVINIIGFICLLLLLTLSQEFARAVTLDSTYFQTTGYLLRSARDFVNHVAMILTVSVGSLMFYFLLFQATLIPRWLSLWGLAGTVFAISASLLVMFHIIDIITIIYILFNLPLILLEIILAIWLIARGFDSKEMNSIAEKSEQK